MSIEIKGINNILKKLDKLSKIETKEAVQDVAKDVEKAIQNKANVFSEKYKCVKVCEPRCYGNSSYIDVGLKSSEYNFEEWKELWYQNYGFDDYGWNFTGQYHITSHLMWFDEAIMEIENDIKKKLKNKLKEQIKQCWRE